jgi:hypothetical protein
MLWYGRGSIFGADLSALHLRIVIAINPLDDAGHIGSDDDRQFRIDRAGGIDAAGDPAGRYRCRLVPDRVAAADRPPGAAGSSKQQHCDRNDDAAPGRKASWRRRLPHRLFTRRRRQSFLAFGRSSAELLVHFALAPGGSWH